ncbi:WSC domain-containing protein [Colletotrichum tanaceti]|uniref:WSC domain-containing protein n=1 Tax=Colletotrichum tanaceti TaxID=1306861 RepID=A0A4U6X8P3_9PEZI|nr:WSC domain-containing protein [Colletotrichum tanaceti]TKW51443.1 WSC domain-containing protein [Colletotrichum tanaceti]
MHVYSYLPVVALAFITAVSAQDNTTVVSAPDDIQDVTNSNYTYCSLNSIAITADTAPSKRSVELVAHGTSIQRSVLKRTLPQGICTSLPSKWSYLGCHTDSPSARGLSGASLHGDDMSQEKCIQFCDGNGYSVAGVEWGRECYCGYLLASSSVKAPEEDCSKPCAGNSDEVCGEGGRINVFTNGDAAPAILAASGDFKSLGCYSDQASARTLTAGISLSGGVRVSDCTSACAAQGYPYAGLEFGRECWCGTGIQNGGKPIAAESCNMACTADKTQYCGGAAAINIYKNDKLQVGGPSVIPDGWSSKSCYTDSPSSRALSYKVPSFDTFSAAQCVSKCAGLNYLYAGLEYGSECYCGNTIDNGNGPAASGCDMSCAGNRADTCGGAGRINVYQAPCKGTPGCNFGYGVVKSYAGNGLTAKKCADYCHAESACQSFQFGIDFSSNKPACLLFKYAIPVVLSRGSGTISPCNTYTFYDSACSL